MATKSKSKSFVEKAAFINVKSLLNDNTTFPGLYDRFRWAIRGVSGKLTLEEIKHIEKKYNEKDKAFREELKSLKESLKKAS